MKLIRRLKLYRVRNKYEKRYNQVKQAYLTTCAARTHYNGFVVLSSNFTDAILALARVEKTICQIDCATLPTDLTAFLVDQDNSIREIAYYKNGMLRAQQDLYRLDSI